ncbi:MAG: hypothetical protein R6V50_07980 [Thermoplasmatota archaeon]
MRKKQYFSKEKAMKQAVLKQEKIIQSRLKSMKTSFDDADKNRICQKCHRKIIDIPRYIGLKCWNDIIIDLETALSSTVLKKDLLKLEKILEPVTNDFYITQPPNVILLCVECYLELLDWLGIPEYDALGIPVDLA